MSTIINSLTDLVLDFQIILASFKWSWLLKYTKANNSTKLCKSIQTSQKG